MGKPFPSESFFRALQKRVNESQDRFKPLGFFDTTFGIRVRPDREGEREHAFVLGFETYGCTDAREVPPEDIPPDVDFVLEAPAKVWREMLASVDALGRIDASHGINTLTHFDHPMRVGYRDPEGQDKLFRFAASVQLVFDLAAAVDSAA